MPKLPRASAALAIRVLSFGVIVAEGGDPDVGAAKHLAKTQPFVRFLDSRLRRE